MMAAQQLAVDLPLAPCCTALGVSRASYYRRQQTCTTTLPPPAPRPTPPRALSSQERQAVLDTLHSERFVDRAPAEVYATLLDEKTYLCSIRTMYRVLHGAQEVRERRNQLRHPHYQKPELLATAYGPEIWQLYERGMLSAEVPLTGRYERKAGAVDLGAVMREIDDARAEEAARRLRMG